MSSSSAFPRDAGAARVGILGLGRTGCRTLLALLELGVRRLDLADGRPASPVDLAGHPLLRPEDAGRPVAQAVRERVARSHPAAELRVVAGPEAGLGWDAWLPRCDLCLLASDVSLPAVAWGVNAACLAAGTPLLPGLCMGPVAQLGPVVRAGEGPCLGCLEQRMRGAARRGSFGAPCPPESGLPRRVGAALAGEVKDLLSRDGAPEPAGRLRYLWRDGRSTEHPLLRSSRCRACAPLGPFMPYRFARKLELEDRPEAHGRILELEKTLVDPLVGAVPTLLEVERPPDDPGAPRLATWVATFPNLWRVAMPPEAVVAGGCDFSDAPARAAALGEAVARQSIGDPPAGEVLVARYRDVADDAVDPLAWDLFHPATRAEPGFPFLPPSREAPLSWVWGTSLTEERPKLVPAARVFVTSQPLTPADHTDIQILSGFAAGGTLETAVARALFEAAERDMLTIAWADRLPVARLEIDRDSPAVGPYLAAFEDCGLRVRCATLELDLGIHLVISMVRSDLPGDPATVIAAAADVDLAEACRRAIKELVACRGSVRHEMLRVGGRLPSPDPREVVDMAAHGLLYARHDVKPHLEPWWNPPASIALPPATGESAYAKLRRSIARLRVAGLEALVVDLTPPEIGRLGLWVVKVLVPGFYPINFDSRWPHFGGRRISRMPVELGLLDAPVPFERLHRVPHPFP